MLRTLLADLDLDVARKLLEDGRPPPCRSGKRLTNCLILRARFVGPIKKGSDPSFRSPPPRRVFARPRQSHRFFSCLFPAPVMNVLIAKHLAAKEKASMSSVTIDAGNTPGAAAQPKPETQPEKPAKGAKPAKKAKVSSKAKLATKKPLANPRPNGGTKKPSHRDDEAR
jgi:hypothetical protein